jgi:hypothetical protein
MGLCRTSGFSGPRKYLRSQGKLQTRGAGRPVFGDRRIAADEATSGAPALPNGRVAALARQRRPEIPPAAGELAVQRPAPRRRRDRRDRGRSRPRPISGAGFLPQFGKISSVSPIPPRLRNWPTNPVCPASHWWSDRSRRRSAPPMSRTARMRWRTTCSARRLTCGMVKCSGDRTGSICLATR